MKPFRTAVAPALVTVSLMTVSLVIGCAANATAADDVLTQSGKVSGVAAKDPTIEVFKGIPYAAPPVGSLRWQPPKPPEPWDDVRACEQFSAVCFQKSNWVTGNPSEDCLYLNVWTQAERTKDQRLPVMVWIHGGGFTQGSGHQKDYDGTQLAIRDVVVVTINYRLGAFGFMAHPGLSAESPHQSSGNYGILDQVAALKWVQENIAAFGGDPDNVTIFGESAGGTSVYLLTATPLSKGLFHRAILQSPWLDPSLFRDLKTASDERPAVETIGLNQAKKILSKNDESPVEKTDLQQLRALSGKDVLEKLTQRWPVATDGWVFPKPPRQIYADGDQHDIPIIVGTNRDEGTMFSPRNASMSVEQFEAAMNERFGDDGKKVVEFFAPKTNKDVQKTLTQLITDGWFVQPARELARAMDRQETPVWMYHFTKPVWGWMGAAHAAEIRYVFGNLESPSDEDAKLSNTWMDYWVQFAKTGDPNLDGKPKWPMYTTDGDKHLQFNDSFKVDSGLRQEACDLLDDVVNIPVPATAN